MSVPNQMPHNVSMRTRLCEVLSLDLSELLTVRFGPEADLAAYPKRSVGTGGASRRYVCAVPSRRTSILGSMMEPMEVNQDVKKRTQISWDCLLRQR